jgi:hypothetical protein
MDQEQKRKQSFLLRLPVSVREEATRIAHLEGTSLNHFIALALAEKISRMEASRAQTPVPSAPPLRMSPYASTPFKLHRTA